MCSSDLSRAVTPDDGRSSRPMLTTIYFLLPAGAVSRWHRVASDEVWHYLEGAPLEILSFADTGEALVTHTIGALDQNCVPEHVVPAGAWQAARSTGAYTLVSCVVGPGFTFEDFSMLRDAPEESARVVRSCPAAAPYV